MGDLKVRSFWDIMFGTSFSSNVDFQRSWPSSVLKRVVRENELAL
jgi:hypothetical protein